MHFFIYNDEFHQCTKGANGGDGEGISCLMLPVEGMVVVSGFCLQAGAGTATIWRSMDASRQKAALILLDTQELQLNSNTNP